MTWEAEVDGSVIHPPAAIGGQTYVVAYQDLSVRYREGDRAKDLLYKLGSDGEVLSTRSLASYGSSAPVISANHVYVATEEGLQTYDLDLDGDHALDGNARGFWVAPAIGEDGTVYALTGDGRLRAYGGDVVPPSIFVAPPGFGLEDPGRGGQSEPPENGGSGLSGLSVLGGGSTVLPGLENTTGGG